MVFIEAGNTGTGFKNALSTSIISPSTDNNFTISPEGLTSGISSAVNGFFVAQPARVTPATKLLAIKSLLVF